MSDKFNKILAKKKKKTPSEIFSGTLKIVKILVMQSKPSLAAT